ncbi:MAG: MFS transporter, partial [Caldanaerobacter sp.]
LLHLKDLKKHLPKIPSNVVIFHVHWFLMSMGSAFLFSFYPLIMKNSFHVNPTLASAVFSVAAALGILVYKPAGIYAKNLGNKKVLQTAVFARSLSLLIMGLAAYLTFSFKEILVLAFFTLIVLTWPFIAVTGIDLATSSSLPKGPSLGLFSANNALSNSLGSFLGGILAHLGSYSILPIASSITLFVAFFFSFLVKEG